MPSPYANFLYFELLLFVVVPTILLGLFGRANARWTLIATAFVVVMHSVDTLTIANRWHSLELWVVLGYALYQAAIAVSLMRWRSRAAFYAAVVLACAPLAAAKFLPAVRGEHDLAFLGISYVTFRALDAIFSIRDGLITTLSPGKYFAFLFFFPTVSSGPIDRFRRFSQDWARKRDRAEFLKDLEIAIQRIFRGFLYKFIIAALISNWWIDRLAGSHGVLNDTAYMYAYSFYLFFDFAGYSAFAIGFSHLFGIRTPENFNLPFIARNIRDFWNRWHMTLSFWFRDHVYMRFLLAAAKGKWFAGKHSASYVALFLTFGLMGLWHGTWDRRFVSDPWTQLHYLLYGFYHATLLSAYDAFARWNKQRKLWGEGRWWRVASILLTFHAVCFGLLIFSGRLTRHFRHAAVPQLEHRAPQAR
jgi:membrane protein involved in D-alanine export